MSEFLSKQDRIYCAIRDAQDRGATAEQLQDAAGIASRTVLQTSLSYVSKRAGVSIVSLTVRDWRTGRHATRYYLREYAPSWVRYAGGEAMA